MWHYAWRSLWKTEPNRYEDYFFDIPTNNFVYKDGIIQKVFPISHLYIPNPSTFVGKITNYPFQHRFDPYKI